MRASRWVSLLVGAGAAMLVLTGAAPAVAGGAPVGGAAGAVAVTQSATVTTEANLRPAPTTDSAVLAVMPAGTALEVLCWATGEPVYGPDRYGSMWLLTTEPGWIHSYLVTPVDVDRCAAGLIRDLPGGGWAYENCDAARAAGAAPVYRGEPGYGPHLDRDNDGIGCE